PGAGFRSWSCIELVAPLVLLVAASAPDLVLAALRPLPGLAFDRDEEAHAPEHAADRVVVRQLARLVHAPEAERLDGGADLRPRADRAFHRSCRQGFVGHEPVQRLPAPLPHSV